MMAGHNENAVRLAALAGDAQIALDKVARGEADAIEGWLAYGAALNEGRSLFDSDKLFGQWVKENGLHLLSAFDLKREAHAGGYSSRVGRQELHPAERAAAMWAAANGDQYDEARSAGEARTVRGIHDKWKQIEAEREKERLDAERKAAAEVARAEAEAKRKEAEAQAKAETAARKAAAEAKSDDDRKAAETKAEEAATAKVEAEKIAEKIEAEIPPEPAGEPDPETAKARRSLTKLTTDALIDEVIGLREENAELRGKLKAIKAENETLKEDMAAFRQEDMGRALGNAQRLARAAEGRMKEFQTTAVRADRRVKLLEAEVKKLRGQLENQVIAL